MKYIIRGLKIKDFFSLHRMYDSLDEKETKPFFHLYWLGLRPTGVKWFFAQIALFSSTVNVLKKLLKYIYPFIIFLSVVAVNERNEVIAFGFLIVRKRLPEKSFLASLGICVKDDYQKRRIATKILKKLITLAVAENIKKIILTVRIDNFKAYRFFKKHGFKKTKTIRNATSYRGHKYDMNEMLLTLDK